MLFKILTVSCPQYLVSNALPQLGHKVDLPKIKGHNMYENSVEK